MFITISLTLYYIDYILLYINCYIDKKHKRKSNNSSVTFATSELDSMTGQPLLSSNINTNPNMNPSLNSATASTTTLPLPPVPPVTPFPPFTYIPGMPGPPKLCRPIWPSFMLESDCRENIPTTKTYVQYLEEIELQYPLISPLGGIRGVSCQSRALGQSVLYSDIPTNSNTNINIATNTNTIMTSSNSNNDSNIYPKSFRIRGRIGRGGRYVTDRIPIYNTNTTHFDSITSKQNSNVANSATNNNPTSNIMNNNSNMTNNSNNTNTTSTSNLLTTTANNNNTSAIKRRSGSSITKYIYATRIPPYEKQHRGTGVELMHHVVTSDNNNNNNNNTSNTNSNNANNSSNANSSNNSMSSYATKNIINTIASKNNDTTSTANIFTNNNTNNSNTDTNNNNDDTISTVSRDKEQRKTRSQVINTSFPVSMPLSRGILPLALKQREKDIYSCSDSEEEVVDFVRSKKPKITGKRVIGIIHYILCCILYHTIRLLFFSY